MKTSTVVSVAFGLIYPLVLFGDPVGKPVSSQPAASQPATAPASQPTTRPIDWSEKYKEAAESLVRLRKGWITFREKHPYPHTVKRTATNAYSHAAGAGGSNSYTVTDYSYITSEEQYEEYNRALHLTYVLMKIAHDNSTIVPAFEKRLKYDRSLPPKHSFAKAEAFTDPKKETASPAGEERGAVGAIPIDLTSVQLQKPFDGCDLTLNEIICYFHPKELNAQLRSEMTKWSEFNKELQRMAKANAVKPNVHPSTPAKQVPSGQQNNQYRRYHRGARH